MKVPQDDLPPDVVDAVGRALGEALAAQFLAENAHAEDAMGDTRPGIRHGEDTDERD